MKFHVALMSFVSSSQRKLIKKEFDGSAIELAEKLLIEYPKYYKNDAEPRLCFGNFIVGNNNELLAGEIGKPTKVKLSEYKDGKFLDEDHKAYPHVHFLWNRDNQLLLLEVNTSIFGNYNSVIENIEAHLNDLLEDYEYTSYIEPQTKKADFWDTVQGFEYLYDITFEMHMPNLLGHTQEEMKEMLDYYRSAYNATNLTTKLSNNDGKLKVSKADKFLNHILDWISTGAGLWKLGGNPWKNDQKLMITSKNDKYMKTVETSIEFENYTPEEVKEMFKDLNVNSLLVDPTNEKLEK